MARLRRLRSGSCTVLDLLAAFLVPEVGQPIHAAIVIPCAIAKDWTIGSLLAIGVKAARPARVHTTVPALPYGRDASRPISYSCGDDIAQSVGAHAARVPTIAGCAPRGPCHERLLAAAR